MEQKFCFQKLWVQIVLEKIEVLSENLRLNIVIHSPEIWLNSMLRVLYTTCRSSHSFYIFLNTVYHGKQTVYHLLNNLFTCSKKQRQKLAHLYVCSCLHLKRKITRTYCGSNPYTGKYFLAFDTHSGNSIIG